jgi:hypothetical protein
VKELDNKEIVFSIGRRIGRVPGNRTTRRSVAYHAWNADAVARESRGPVEGTQNRHRPRIACPGGGRPQEWPVAGADSGQIVLRAIPGEKTGMSISHETIYTCIHAQPKGEPTRAGLVPRTGHEKRKPRGRKKTARHPYELSGTSNHS